MVKFFKKEMSYRKTRILVGMCMMYGFFYLAVFIELGIRAVFQEGPITGLALMGVSFPFLILIFLCYWLLMDIFPYKEEV